MNLTTLIKESDVSQRLKETFPNIPAFNLKGELLAPAQTKSYGMIGTALDYLLRFRIERDNPNAIHKQWVAQNSLDLLTAIGADREAAQITKSLEYAQKAYEKFLQDGIVSEALLRGSILLAKIDLVYRVGFLDPNLEHADAGDIEDLRRLCQIIPSELFKGRSVYLNPSFKSPIKNDADLIIDGCLIDFKTTKYLEFKREHLDQLLGYYILSLLEPERHIPIDSLGIYYARHGLLFRFPAPQVPAAFLKWFTKRIKMYEP